MTNILSSRPTEQVAVLSVLLRNSYFAHSEQILLNMLTSDSLEERLDAVEKIRCIRSQNLAKDNQQVRIFNTPRIAMDGSFKTMADFYSANSEHYVPPLLRRIPLWKIKNMALTRMHLSHTYALELPLNSYI